MQFFLIRNFFYRLFSNFKLIFFLNKIFSQRLNTSLSIYREKNKIHSAIMSLCDEENFFKENQFLIQWGYIHTFAQFVY